MYLSKKVFLRYLGYKFWYCSSQIRKRAAGEVGVISNGDCNSKSKTSRTHKQDVVNHGQVDGVHGKDSASHEPTKEAAAVPVLKNPASSDASQPPKVWSSFLYVGETPRSYSWQKQKKKKKKEMFRTASFQTWDPVTLTKWHYILLTS
jgi:hypothetical protein